MSIECSEKFNDKGKKEVPMESLSLMVEKNILDSLTEVSEIRGMDRDQLIRNILAYEVNELKGFFDLQNLDSK